MATAKVFNPESALRKLCADYPLAWSEITATYDALGTDTDDLLYHDRATGAIVPMFGTTDAGTLRVPRGYRTLRDRIRDAITSGDYALAYAIVTDTFDGTVCSAWLQNIAAIYLDMVDAGIPLVAVSRSSRERTNRPRASANAASAKRHGEVRTYQRNADGTYTPTNAAAIAHETAQNGS